MSGNKKKIAVMGFPIKHSLSPTIHNYWLKKNNINGSYTTIKTPLNELEKKIATLCNKDYVGVNLTIPLKERAIKLLDKTDAIVNFTKAVNTLIFHKNKFIEGRNTDVIGFKNSLLESPESKIREKAIIIGNGGAARAILYCLIKLKYKHIVVCARTKKKSEQLKKDMEKFKFKNSRIKVFFKNIKNLEKESKKTNLLVNATPLGMKGFPDLSFSLNELDKQALVFDIVYNPLETTLLKKAKKKGNKTINGLKMLLYQAQEAFKIWFDKKPKITKLLEKILIKEIK